MSTYPKNPINTVKRGANRASYDKEAVYQILDDGLLCHVGYLWEGKPVVIPTAYGREDDTIYIHGAVANRMIKGLLKSGETCITVTHLDGLVLARSAFHHSANYRSAVVFGQVEKITDPDEKLHALKVIMDQMLPQRWDESRQPNEKELKATLVVAIKIAHASAKIRQGDPVDEKEDLSLPFWGGYIPINQLFLAPVSDQYNNEKEKVPSSIINYIAQKNNVRN